MDAFYRHKCLIDQFEYALTILTTIVSRQAPERAVIDAGRFADFSVKMVIERSKLHPVRWKHEALKIEQCVAECDINRKYNEIVFG